MAETIGKIIEQIICAKGLSMSEVSRRLGHSRNSVRDIVKRTSIDTDLLEKISEVLDYDFFQHFLREDTIERLKMTHNVKKTKVIVELELTDEEMEEYKLFNRVINELQDNYSNNIVAEKNINYGNSTNE